MLYLPCRFAAYTQRPALNTLLTFQSGYLYIYPNTFYSMYTNRMFTKRSNFDGEFAQQELDELLNALGVGRRGE